jgi:hypothetical protein
MSVNLQAIGHAVSRQVSSERAQSRDTARSDADFGTVLEEGVARAATYTRRPGSPTTPAIPTPSDGTTPGDGTGTGDPSGDGGDVTSTGQLSTDPHTAGMYVPPDFYHGGSYSPVFDHQDANGNWVATPRFEGQVVYSQWRGSLPPDYDPNARVKHDPLNYDQSSNYWKQDANGNWVKRATGYGGIPLNDDGTPMFTPDPTKYPEYFASSPDDDTTT